MNIDWLSDVGAPVVVAAADIYTFEKQPNWNRWVHYGGAVIGYGSMMFMRSGKYSDFLKNLGIASAPLALRNLYDTIVNPTPSIQGRPAVTRMVPYPGPNIARTYEPEFKTVGAV